MFKNRSCSNGTPDGSASTQGKLLKMQILRPTQDPLLRKKLQGWQQAVFVQTLWGWIYLLVLMGKRPAQSHRVTQ